MAANLVFDREECLNLEEALRLEWLETNGLGGYASSTLLNCHTRKYHSLFSAVIPALNGKFNLLSKLEDAVSVGDKIFSLSTNKFPGVFHPTGHQYLAQVDCSLYPRWFYRMGDIELVRSILMPEEKEAVLVAYELLSAGRSIILQLRPWLAYRSIHALTRANLALRVKTYVEEHALKIDPYAGMPPLYFRLSLPHVFYPGPDWIHNLEYLKERSRGYPHEEDLFCPGVIEIKMNPGEKLVFEASLSPSEDSPSLLWEAEVKRRNGDRSRQFFIKNGSGERSLVAGYPWFDEWGRDAMIALPGLAFCTDRDEWGFEVLRTFARREKKGLIPNFLAVNGGEAAYNSIDASLWFFWAVYTYFEKTGDLKKIEADLWPVMGRILSAFAEGRAPHVTLKENGLIWVGDEWTQLTWMDAKVGGRPVTPRHGFAVELNALWFNALRVYLHLAKLMGARAPSSFLEIGNRLEGNFSKIFWGDSFGYLADVVNDRGPDFSVRPNQIFAASLPFSPLSLNEKRGVVACVTEKLVTPYGLRTLSPDDPSYCPHYHGSPEERDRAYHQGTVWPWLVGHYVDAALAASAHPERTKIELREMFSPLFNLHTREGGIGCISEIFDGNPPHTPKGAFHQAWSVGEVFRARLRLKEGGAQ